MMTTEASFPRDNRSAEDFCAMNGFGREICVTWMEHRRNVPLALSSSDGIARLFYLF
jgi:hypothetical protein